jgi:inorganic pyrophosphatase
MYPRLVDIPAGRNVPDILNAIIEIPRGSRNKYEYDEELNLFKLDRVLASPMHYPTAYGFVPSTRFSDGDPVDIMVLIDESTFVGCLIEVRPIGVMRMIDGGKQDDKIIAVPVADQHFSHYVSLDSMKPHSREEIKYFYSHYKNLEGLETDFIGWGGIDLASEMIVESMSRFRETAGPADVNGSGEG